METNTSSEPAGSQGYANGASLKAVTPPEIDIPALPAVAAPPPRKRAPLVFGVLAILAVTGAGTAWLLARGNETTDDAFVEGHVANVAARIPGQVVKVVVADNQKVTSGDVLVELDDRDQRARLDAARADEAAAQAQVAAAEAQLSLTERNASAGLRQARGGVTQANAMEGSSTASVAQARADLAAAESRRALAELDFHRAEKLRESGAAAPAELDARRAQFEQAQATVDQANARVRAATVGIDGARGNTEAASGRLQAALSAPQQIEAARAQLNLARARLLQARAALEQAELNLSYTQIRAPQAGVVARRTVELGQMVDPARPLLSIVAVEDSWVVANFKEDQIAEMKPGQSVELRVDAYPGKKLVGHVESLAGGTGSRFALLPPDNASGNFTKVVQRVPVLIRVDGSRELPLRPGMSVVAKVSTKG